MKLAIRERGEFYYVEKDGRTRLCSLIAADKNGRDANYAKCPHKSFCTPEARFTSSIIFCYTTQHTQGSACQHGLRSECCNG